MAKTYHATINQKRKYFDRKGVYYKNKVNKKPYGISETCCIQDCTNCPNNRICQKLLYT